MEQKFSLPSGTLGARLPEEKPTPTRRSEGTIAPKQPASQWVTKNTDLPDSTAPVLDLPSAKTISEGITSALYRMDREQAMASGESGEDFDARNFKAELAKAVAERAMTNDAANRAWQVAFPHIDPNTVK
jgi:hypothetical protein